MKKVNLDPQLIVNSKNIKWEDDDFTVLDNHGKSTQFSFPKLIELLLLNIQLFRVFLMVVCAIQICCIFVIIWLIINSLQK